jgi:hypothetical protein
MRIKRKRKTVRFMFRITGEYDQKIGPKGEVIRLPSVIDVTLNTEPGVLRFLKEMRPFKSINIRDSATKENRTDYFMSILLK